MCDDRRPFLDASWRVPPLERSPFSLSWLGVGREHRCKQPISSRASASNEGERCRPFLRSAPCRGCLYTSLLIKGTRQLLPPSPLSKKKGGNGRNATDPPRAAWASAVPPTGNVGRNGEGERATSLSVRRSTPLSRSKS